MTFFPVTTMAPPGLALNPLLEAVLPVAPWVTLPVTVGLPLLTVIAPLEWTVASVGSAGGAAVTLVLESISRLPLVRMAFDGLYGANRYSTFRTRRLASPCPY